MGINRRPLMEENQQLSGSGCARKFPLKELELNHLSKLRFNHPNLFLGTSDFDDVGAYLISENQLLVQSVDMIASLPLSPYEFGTICSAHCLSDIYAKGAIPLTALNILFHSASPYYPEQIDNILSGITDKLNEAKTTLVGGHTINEKVLYCGLMVSGVINKEDIVLIKGTKVGDNLILTKPLGTGILSMAVRNKTVEQFPQKAVSSMAILNDLLLNLKNKSMVHSCTDVTGSGLAGSLYNLAIKNSVKIEILESEIPFYEEAWVNAINEDDGSLFNRDYVRGLVTFGNHVKKEIRNLVFDPQTSGGLLLSVSPQNTSQIMDEIFSHNTSIEPKIIGQITGDETPEIQIV